MSRFVQMSKLPINLHVSNHLVPFGWAPTRNLTFKMVYFVEESYLLLFYLSFAPFDTVAFCDLCDEGFGNSKWRVSTFTL